MSAHAQSNLELGPSAAEPVWKAVKEDIKAQVERSRALRRAANQTCGEEKHRLNLHRAAVGRETRVMYLLYGFLRGVPFHKVESSRPLQPNVEDRFCRPLDIRRNPAPIDVVARLYEQYTGCEGGLEAIKRWHRPDVVGEDMAA